MAELTREKLHAEYAALKSFRVYLKSQSKQAQDFGYVIHDGRIKYCLNLFELEVMIASAEKRLGIEKSVLEK